MHGQPLHRNLAHFLPGPWFSLEGAFGCVRSLLARTTHPSSHTNPNCRIEIQTARGINYTLLLRVNMRFGQKEKASTPRFGAERFRLHLNMNRR
jgi:hypothetical protein